MPSIPERPFHPEITRRDFLWLMSVAGSAVALPPLLTGCATDPVTGKKTLVGLSEAQEVSLDKEQSPHQFSADLGAVQDPGLNNYVQGVGEKMWQASHRPKMPYSARVLNANYLNAYTFPGGSMGATRAIMLDMDSEDELAALLGHETGHVNARHAAERAGKQLVAELAIVAGAVALSASESGQQYVPLLQLGSQIGASALLAKYSRDNEREADSLSMGYMVKAGYNPNGMVGVMDMLRTESKRKPNLIETMFASHPMSEERYQTASREAGSTYAAQRKRGIQRDRYMDHTAGLRRIRPTIESCQKGETLLAKKELTQAEGEFAKALRHTPSDYAANVLMAKTLMAQKKTGEARSYLANARAIYPSEGQAVNLDGIVKLSLKQPEAALAAFRAYDKLLPGNPNTLFLTGVAYEDMRNTKEAARYFYRYAQTGAQTRETQYAVSRLKQWGVVK
jgi:beta-barrel assembly-enhancing protease